MTETTATKAAKAVRPCACGVCSLTTKGTFAQGHDAKLVSQSADWIVDGHAPEGHWMAAYDASQQTDIEERIGAAYREFVVRYSPALATKFDSAARNRWATADKRAAAAERKLEAATLKAAGKTKGVARAERLQAALEGKHADLAVEPVLPTELIAAVREHAQKFYEVDGWDAVVEAWSDDEIAAVIGRARTAKTAIQRVHKAAKDAGDYAEDIRNA